MAAVATRHSNNNSPRPNGQGMTSSPRSNRTSLQNQEPTDPSNQQPEDDLANESSKDKGIPTTNAPLAPPPRPSQNGDGEYYSTSEGRSHLSKEPNPFENAFGNPADTPGKPSLPGVTSLTSPASLLPGITPGWPGSLRSGPLSPAMLTGPTGNNDYFNSDHHFSGSFPTPNESSLRTGLTPGGGGSMFPQPSPNSQAIYNQLQSGGATPGTLDFHRTAMTARAQSHATNYSMPNNNNATSQPQQDPSIQPDLDRKPYLQNNSNQQQDNQDPFGSHQTNDAANGLFMLAQAGGQRNNQQQQYQQQQQQHYQGHDKRASKNSVGSTMSGSTEGAEDQYSEEESKPQMKSKGKKGSSAKNAQNGKRKTEDMTPSKSQGAKRSRVSNASSMGPDDMDMEDDMDGMDGMDDIGSDGKKMTDEEKRKNFLERNRVAALKCRQRKKQWLANLQQKVEIFSSENDALAATVTQLREEIVGLKTLLLAHKDCPVSQAQGISGMAMQQIAGDSQHYANPYGMAASMQQANQMAQANMPRR